MWPSYAHRIKRDLADWAARGWVTPEGARAIEATLTRPAAPRRTPFILAMLGAILLALAAMSFVAANWAAIPKLAKTGLLIATMWSAYGAACALTWKRHAAFAEAALLLGLALFGASIMLIAQIYHISGRYPDALLVWSLGALATAGALKSRAALSLAILLITAWSYGETIDFNQLHFPFLLLWGLALILVIEWRWRAGLHLLILSGLTWAALMLDPIIDRTNWNMEHVSALYLLLSLALWIGGDYLKTRGNLFATALSRYGMSIAIILYWWLPLLEDIEYANPAATHTWLIMWALATLPLVAMSLLIFRSPATAHAQTVPRAHLIVIGLIFASVHAYLLSVADYDILWRWLYPGFFVLSAVLLIARGAQEHDRFTLNLGFAAFAAEAIHIYLETLGSLLETSLFFALGGLLLIVGAAVLMQVHRRLTKSSAAEKAAP